MSETEISFNLIWTETGSFPSWSVTGRMEISSGSNTNLIHMLLLISLAMSDCHSVVDNTNMLEISKSKE